MSDPHMLQIEDLIQQVNTLEAQFRTLDEIIKQLQEQRDIYKALYEACKEHHGD